ncbi:MAG: hypothetical protein C4303_08410, partial [candidate division GAL15 bacterium]
GRPRDWGIAGLVWGGGFYTYLAARMTVIPLAVAGAVRWRRQPGQFPRPAVAAFLGCAFLTLLPLGLFFARHPDHFALRGAQTAAFTGQRPFLAVAGEQAVKVLGMFFVWGDEQPRHNTGRRPVFDPLLALAFGVGGWRAAREAPFTVFWLGAMLLPTFLSTEAPHYLRASGALPVAVFWAALGLWTAAEGFARRLRRPWGVSLLLAAGLGLSFPWHSVAYFDPAWWGRAEVWGAFSLDSWEVAREVRRFLETHPSGTVILSERLWAGRAEMVFLLSDRTRVQVHRVEEELDCRWVAWTHDVLWDSPTDVLPIPLGPLQELLRHARPELTYVATSEAVRASLVRHLGVDGSRVRVIPPGVCLESLGLVSPQTRRILQELAWEDHFPVLLVPVRVTRRKNLELAVQVAACLRAEGLDPLVAVTGPLGAHTAANARYLQELQELRRRLGLNEQVAFLVERGIRCSARTVGELYLACDAVLIPSVLEGFGLPVAEAGLLRVPVFCSRIPAAVEVAGQLAHFFSVDEPPESVARRIARELELDRAARLRRQVVERLGCRHVASKALGTLVAELASAAGR